ncbi:MAG: hypothetical protein Q8K61_10590 [Gallionella sp.]|nr:hypothetical protein [Gallionella sp.]
MIEQTAHQEHQYDESTPTTRAHARQIIVLPELLDQPYTDPILPTLAEKDKPQEEVICAHCPNAMWMTTHNQLKCFCKVTRSFSWSTAEPIPTTRCTGQLRAVAEMQAALADK